MTKHKHTPTPWKQNEDCFYDSNCIWLGLCNTGRGSDWIDVNPLGMGVAKANASFIVQACNSFDDLLAACQALLERYDAPNGPAITSQVSAMRKAVAKATGASP